VQFAPEVQSGKCWTGAHAHLQIENPAGKLVDAEQFLNSVGCSFVCPVGDRC